MSKSFLRAFITSVFLSCLFSSAQAAVSSSSVQHLEREFERQLKGFLLTSPAADNAADTLKQLKSQKPRHPLIKQGPMRIADRYVLLAEKSIKRKRTQSAYKYLDKALSFYPKNKQAVTLRAELDLKRTERFGGLGNGIVVINGGCFEMGSPKNEPHHKADERLHKACVKEFGMAQREVTYAEYDRYTTATSQDKLPDRGWGRNKRPAVGVSWEQADGYAKWLSQITGQRYRLPTEAEWEYAARAGGETPFHTGNKMSKRQGNINPDSQNYSPRGKTQNIGRYKPNAWGLYDMHGNVWEWTCSVYRANYKGKHEQKCASKSNSKLRVLRGGSWYSRPAQTRVANRGTAQYIDGNHGFRLVQDIRP